MGCASDHALLSPSGAVRWMACPGSARLEELMPDSSSKEADEGTLAHELADLYIKHALGEVKTREYNKRLKTITANAQYNNAMDEHIALFRDVVLSTYDIVKKECPDAICMTEHRFELDAFIPESFGTADVVIVSDKLLFIADLKYGAGVQVRAERNPQLMIYALGALVEFGHLYEMSDINLYIHQPRKDNFEEWAIKKDELWTWVINELRPAATLAFAGGGELKAGESGEGHCRFCRAKATCKTRAAECLKLEKHRFTPPELLDEEAISDILQRAEGFTRWIEDVEAYALQAALKGTKWPGFKLVEGRSKRKYADEAAAIAALRAEGYADDMILALKGISALEAAITKKEFNRILEPTGIVVKPPGSPKLAPESDSRPELKRGAEMFNDGFTPE